MNTPTFSASDELHVHGLGVQMEDRKMDELQRLKIERMTEELEHERMEHFELESFQAASFVAMKARRDRWKLIAFSGWFLAGMLAIVGASGCGI